ncbi:MAG TPA: hypothetical protein VJU82_14870, partial [Acidobacteriaceae bacterium]|nr:hypothetical protein [Acidobacteriaceae bacterium]
MAVQWRLALLPLCLSVALSTSTLVAQAHVQQSRTAEAGRYASLTPGEARATKLVEQARAGQANALALE